MCSCISDTTTVPHLQAGTHSTCPQRCHQGLRDLSAGLCAQCLRTPHPKIQTRTNQIHLHAHHHPLSVVQSVINAIGEIARRLQSEEHMNYSEIARVLRISPSAARRMSKRLTR
jgi:hypothetical protein